MAATYQGSPMKEQRIISTATQNRSRWYPAPFCAREELSLLHYTLTNKVKVEILVLQGSNFPNVRREYRMFILGINECIFQAKKVQINYILQGRGIIICTYRVPPQQQPFLCTFTLHLTGHLRMGSSPYSRVPLRFQSGISHHCLRVFSPLPEVFFFTLCLLQYLGAQAWCLTLFFALLFVNGKWSACIYFLSKVQFVYCIHSPFHTHTHSPIHPHTNGDRLPCKVPIKIPIQPVML